MEEATTIDALSGRLRDGRGLRAIGPAIWRGRRIAAGQRRVGRAWIRRAAPNGHRVRAIPPGRQFPRPLSAASVDFISAAVRRLPARRARASGDSRRMPFPNAAGACRSAGQLSEHFRHGPRDRCGGRRGIGPLQFEKMLQTRSGFAQDGIGGVERRRILATAPSHIRVLLRGGPVEGLLERLVVQPRAARLGESGEMIGHARGVRAGGVEPRKDFPASLDANALCPLSQSWAVSWTDRTPCL